MLVRAMSELVGDEVLATDGRVGVLKDFYFDRDCWQLCYFLIASRSGQMLVSVACVEAATPARGRLSLGISGAQLAAGADAWSLDAALEWLDDVRVCSARHALHWHVAGEEGPVGELAEFLVDRKTWSIDYLVARVIDGFGAREVVLPLDWADPLDPRERMVRMRRTRAQLRGAPSAGAASLRPSTSKG